MVIQYALFRIERYIRDSISMQNDNNDDKLSQMHCKRLLAQPLQMEIQYGSDTVRNTFQKMHSTLLGVSAVSTEIMPPALNKNTVCAWRFTNHKAIACTPHALHCKHLFIHSIVFNIVYAINSAIDMFYANVIYLRTCIKCIACSTNGVQRFVQIACLSNNNIKVRRKRSIPCEIGMI